jgi:GT2 family glycosyltransferase
MLGAETVIYPNALAKLSAALDRSPEAAFSHGIVAKSDGSGLLDYAPWELWRLCEGQHIESLTLVRRSVFDELGGLDGGLEVASWVDYDFCLRLAAGGYHEEFVSAFVGVCHVRPPSPVGTRAVDTEGLVPTFRARYPSLPWPEDLAR